MSFGKPVIIVGEQTFSAVLDSTTAPFFYYKGIYGLGSGGSSNARLVADIRRLAENRDERLALGHFARGFVVRHFGLETVSAELAALCRRTVADNLRFADAAADGLRTAAVYLRERRFLTPSRSL